MREVLELKGLNEGELITDKVVYVQSYAKKAYAGGTKHFIVGNFTKGEESIAFKIWDEKLVEAVAVAGLEGKAIRITGSVTSYMQKMELKIDKVDVEGMADFPVKAFLKTADVAEIYKDFVELVQREVEPKGITLLNHIFKNEGIWGRFKEEFAGSKMHDALVGGLMNHTTKMLKIAKTIVENEPRIKEQENFKDLLMLGVILHDIGKVKEMHMGVYQENSFVTHRTQGMEMLMKYKEEVVEAYDETFYYQILSVIQGHHGDFGDKPTTLVAYLVHLIDMVDAMTTGAFDRIDRGDVNIKAGHETVYMNGSNLVF